MKKEYQNRLPKLWETYLEQVPDDEIPTINQLVDDDGTNLWKTYAEAVNDISSFLIATKQISLENIPATMIDALTRVGLGETNFTEDYEFVLLL